MNRCRDTASYGKRHRRPPRTPLALYKSLPEGTRIQLIENKLVMEPAPLVIHQDLTADISFAMYDFVKRQGLGKVLFAPVDVYLDQENAFQPDILYISLERSDIIKRNGIYGPPDLIAEILSPSTSGYDREEKKRVYERNGVKEYWTVNPISFAAQGYRLVKKCFHPLPSSKGSIYSDLLGRKFEFGS